MTPVQTNYLSLMTSAVMRLLKDSQRRGDANKIGLAFDEVLKESILDRAAKEPQDMSDRDVESLKPKHEFDPLGDIKAFHEKFYLTYEGAPRELEPQLGGFRRKFLLEEIEEYENGWAEHDLAKQFDALVDLVYVALGTSYLHGFDFAEAWRRVHAANMTKERSKSLDVNSDRGSCYDVIKPPGFVPPSYEGLV